jgi:hypothetical protein
MCRPRSSRKRAKTLPGNSPHDRFSKEDAGRPALLRRSDPGSIKALEIKMASSVGGLK